MFFILYWPQIANVMGLEGHPDPRPSHVWTGRKACRYSTKSAMIYFLIPASHVDEGSTTHYTVRSLKSCITCKKNTSIISWYCNKGSDKLALHYQNINFCTKAFTPRKGMLLWPEVCCFICMNEQLKCMEMLLRNFLHSLEHCIGTSTSWKLS